MMKFLAAGALTAVALIAPATANAGASDATFLAAVHRQGIVHAAGDQGLIQVGHLVCTALASGYGQNAVVDGLTTDAPRMSPGDAEFLVRTSAASYCPDYVG
jgi:hypothetical protein